MIINEGDFGTVESIRAGQGRSGRKVHPVAEVLEGRQLLAVITVNVAGDDYNFDSLSLRQAIEISNGTLSVASLTASQADLVVGPLTTPNTIDFNIPGTGPFIIESALDMPLITSPGIINGYSQPGAHPNTNGPDEADNAVLEVELISGSPDNRNGLEISAYGATVEGLAIGGFFYYGILIDAPGESLIEGNFIGTNVSGSGALSNGNGIAAIGGGSNTIGGTASSASNVISGNIGAGLNIIASVNNLVEGNLVGTDVTGTKAVPNPYGIFTYGNFDSNTIGGTASGASNVISGNTYDGLVLITGGYLVEGNFIGTDVTGTEAVSNGTIGIDVESIGSETIGGTASGAGNVISGNTADDSLSGFISNRPFREVVGGQFVSRRVQSWA